MKGFHKAMLAVLVITLAAAGLTACAPPGGWSTKVTVTYDKVPCDIDPISDPINYAYPTKDCELNNDAGGPFPAIEVGKANSCMYIATTISGRNTMCRVVAGYDDRKSDPNKYPALRDRRNWRIEIDGGDAAEVGHGRHFREGYAIALYSGALYEGCVIGPKAGQVIFGVKIKKTTFHCDYQISKPVVSKRSSNVWDYVLRKAWNFTLYVGDTVGCAAGITGLTIGKPITLGLLTACAEGPL